MVKLKRCPVCDVTWEGDKIFDSMRACSTHDNKSDKELEIYLREMYGDPNVRYGVNYVMVEDRDLYDGALYYQCMECDGKVGRFSGKVLESVEDIYQEAKDRWKY